MPTLSEPPDAVKARLSLYKARRKAFVAALPFPPAFPNAEAMRSRMARTVDNEVAVAGATMSAHPEPVARLRDELLFWVDFYERDSRGGVADTTEARWNTRSLAAWRKALDLLDQGEPAEAFGMVAVMEKHPDLYGPVPDPLNLTGPRWLDLPPALLPPGHLFSDEQPDTEGE